MKAFGYIRVHEEVIFSWKYLPIITTKKYFCVIFLKTLPLTLPSPSIRLYRWLSTAIFKHISEFYRIIRWSLFFFLLMFQNQRERKRCHVANLVLAQLRNSRSEIKRQSRTWKEGNLTCTASPWLLCKGDMEKHAVSNNDSTCRFNQAKLSAIWELWLHTPPPLHCPHPYTHRVSLVR